LYNCKNHFYQGTGKSLDVGDYEKVLGLSTDIKATCRVRRQVGTKHDAKQLQYRPHDGETVCLASR